MELDFVKVTSSLGTVRPQPFVQETGFFGLKSHSFKWPDIRSSLITAVHPKTSFSHLINDIEA